MKWVALWLLALPALAEEKPKEDEATRRVVYIPEIVKQELREEIKKEVLEQAKREGWAAPNSVPAWLSRIKPSGDVRARFDRTFFDRGNANGGEFPDFNGINTNKPFDVNFVDPSNERYLDVDQNRSRPRLRARLGVDAEIGQGFSAGLRFASGESSGPVSTNQTLGATGDFSKVQLWIDRAFVRYGVQTLSLLAGRFDNPFFGTELLWSPDLNFDGVAIAASLDAGRGFRPFLIAGAFPLSITSLNFPPERPDKFFSRNKWLYAVQLGTEWRTNAYSFKVAGAFYDFDKAEGRVSGPCDTNLSFVTCDTDDTRPQFAQNGNTYLALRTPSPAAQQLEASSTVPRYQFFGLASRFRELVATARFDVVVAPRVTFAADAEYVRNAGFRASQIADAALNNRGPAGDGDLIGPFAGGNNGFFGRLAIGSPAQEQRWDWRFRLSYRYLQSDAALDALNDPDFGLGGTNLKGYGLDATLFVADGVAATARWLSADQIVGPKYGVDVLHLEVMARF